MTYAQPRMLGEALQYLERAAPCVIAGGTDVYPAMGAAPRPAAFLDVTGIDGFTEISVSDAGVRFGAAVTWSEIVRADLPPAFDALRQAAREVGSLQIQNAGTIAGNLCNASPAADGVPPLLALEAQVEVASAARGQRVMPLAEFVRGVRQTALAADELVTAVLVPKTPQGMVSAFEKLGSRKYLVISIAMTAVNLLLDEAGRIAEARVAVGSCSAVAQRLGALEAALIGADPAQVTVTDAQLAPLAPIDDVRGTAGYRLEAVAEQIRRAIGKAVGV